MTELEDRWARFFAAVNSDAAPYPWQTALMARIAETGVWPEAITPPTGAGKSSVVDVHAFLVAEHARDGGRISRPPRRLVLVAPRRVLVDDQYERAAKLAFALDAAEDEIVREVAESLRALVTTREEATGSPLGIALLRGGVLLDQSWRLDPARCQIVCATPQMWGSRLLMRGYRGSRRSRNLETGLLSRDVAVVIDEAHLHGRLIETARKMATEAPSPLGLQVVAMSATPTERTGHGLTAADYEDTRLVRRVRANKAIDVREVEDWRRGARTAIVARARELRAGKTVGVFVNTVARALHVAAELRDGGAEVALVCSRMRPADLGRLRRDHEGLLDARGNDAVDYLVTTQSLEVGVDLDLAAIVTEIAPASALAQRAGRLNRSGSLDVSAFSVVALADLAAADPGTLGATFAPYAADEIVAAAGWLAALGGDGSPERIGAVPLPIASRPPLPDLSRAELETLAMAGEALAADVEPAFYLDEPRDSEDQRVSIAVRAHLDLGGEAVRQALLAAPPRAHELAVLSFDAARDVCEICPGSWLIRTTAGALDVMPLDEPAFRTGDVIVIPAGSRVGVQGVIGRPRGKVGTGVGDVMAERPDGDPDVVVELPAGEVREAIAGDRLLGRRATREALAAIVARSGAAGSAVRLRTHRRLADLELRWCEDSAADRGLLVLRSAGASGRLPRTDVSEAERGPITVDAHQEAVAERLDRIVDALGAPELEPRRAQLLAAARCHDEGKRHPRFQRRMGAAPGGEALAKPAPGHVADRGDGWRHEQISAGYAAWRHDRDPLIVALVAAHHGHGLPLFDRDDREALAEWADHEDELAAELMRLFGAYGRYESDRARLRRQLGFHPLAYLEALLRCADMQVSREGG